MKYVVVASDGALFGTFTQADDAAAWAMGEADDLGDWFVDELVVVNEEEAS